MGVQRERARSARGSGIRPVERLARAVRVGVAAALMVAGGGVARGVPTEYVWNGGIGVWGDPLTWDLGVGTPSTANDNATVSAGEVTLDADYSINAFTLAGGRLEGAFDLTTGGLFTWSGGAIVNPGTVQASAGMLITGAGAKILVGRTLINDAAQVALWNAGDLILSDGARVVNNGTFTAAFDGRLQSVGAGNVFENAGLFRKTLGAGGANSTKVESAFNNAGAVEVQAGRLELIGGGSGAGTFSVSTGAELAFRSDYGLLAGSSVGGAGDIAVEFGTTTVAGAYAITGTTRVHGGTLSFGGNATTGGVEMSGGVLTGAGTLTASGAVVWSGGVLAGAGVLESTGTMSITAGGARALSGRTVINSGAVTWSGGDIPISDGGVIANAGTFDVTTGGQMQSAGGGGGRFDNTGLLTKSAGGDATINVPLNNSGTVRVSAATLTLSGGGTATGRFEALAGGRLRVVSNYTFGAGSRVTGGGAVEFSGGINTVAGTYDPTGRTEVWSGMTTFTGAGITGFGDMMVVATGGVAVIDTGVVATAGKLDMYGGAIDGGGHVTFTGLATWDSGPMKGSGVTTAAGGLAISGGSGKALEGRTVINAASSTGVWSGGTIFGFNGGTLRNDGTLSTNFDGSFLVANGTPQLYNTGLFVKTAGAGGATAFGAAMNNTGTVRVEAGTVFLGGGSSTGHFEVLAGATVQFGGVYTLNAGATITGAGRALVSNGLNVEGVASADLVEQVNGGVTGGAGQFTVKNFTWRGGRLTGTGTTTVTTALTMDGGDGKEIDGGRTLRVAAGATATWSAGNLAVHSQSTLENAGTFDWTFDGLVLPGGTVRNTGLFTKSGGVGNAVVSAAFDNSGTVRVTSGSLFLGAGASTGHFDLAGGPVALGAYTLGQGATVTGTNALSLLGAVNVAGDATVERAQQANGGSTTGPGNLSIGRFTWTGGQLTGSGTTTVTSQGFFEGAGKELTGRTLRVAAGATATWSAGDIAGFPNSRLVNDGTFDAAFDGGFLYAVAPSASFDNAGLFLKSAGAGTTTFTTRFNNTGVARVASGTLVLTGGGSSTGNFDLVGGTLDLLSGYELAGGTTITGTNAARVIGPVSVTGAVSAARVWQSAGVVSGAGTITIGQFDWTGGTLGGNGVTAVGGVSNVDGADTKVVDGRTLRVAAGATANWNGGDLRLGGGGRVENLGTFNAAGDKWLLPGDGAVGAFDNTGTFAKTSPSATAVFVPFNSAGTVKVLAGSLGLAGGGSATGSFELTDGPLDLSGGYVLGQGASLTGAHPARVVGDVSVSGQATAERVVMTAGTMSGAGTLSVGEFTWSGGTLGGVSGIGVTRVTTSAALGGGGMLIDGRTLRIAAGAAAAWTSGVLSGANGGRVDNLGLFTTDFDGTLAFQTGVVPAFDNAGEFRKTGGAGVTQVNVAFNNPGAVKVQSGMLRLNAGGAAAGTFDAAAGTAVELGFDYALNNGAAFTGAGVARVLGGTTTVTGTATAANFQLAGGTLSGGGTLEATSLTWQGGVMTGSGVTRATSALTLGSAGGYGISGRTVAVGPAATATWTAGAIAMFGGGRVDNGGLFTTDFAGSVDNAGGAPSTFANAGEFRKTAGGATTINVPFDNAGTVTAAPGTIIRLAGGGAAGGAFDAGAAGAIELAFDYALNNGAAFTGAGAARVTGGVTTVTGNATAAKLEMMGGAVSGAGTLEATTLTWQAGAMTGTGVTRATSALTLASAGGYSIGGRTVAVGPAATATWTAGTIGIASAGRVENNGLFTTDFAGSIDNAGGLPSTFANAGEFRKTAGGTTTVGVPFDNTGTVKAAVGTTIRLAGGGAATGAFDAAAGGAIELAFDYALNNGAAFTGAGAARVTGGVTTVTGQATAANFELIGGALSGAGTLEATSLTWQGGAMTGTGITRATSALTLASAGGYPVSTRTVAVGPAATAAWTAGTIGMAHAARIENGGIFTTDFAGSVDNGGGAASTFANAGEFRKTAGGTTQIGVRFENAGTVKAAAGTTVRLAGGGSAGGTFDAAAGAAVELAFDYTLNAGAAFTGPGVGRVAGGTTTVAGAVAANRFELAGGVLGGPGLLTAAELNWVGGALGGSGATRVTSALTMASAAAGHAIDGRTLEVGGGATASWTAGSVAMVSGARVDNLGLFMTNFDGLVSSLGGVPAPALVNTGEFRKTGGGGGATQVGARFENPGVVKVQAGTLRLVGGGSATGAFDVSAGAAVEFAADYALNAGVTFTGAGVARVTGGTTSVNAAVSAGTLRQTGGALSVAAGQSLTAAALEQTGGTMSGPGAITAAAFAWKGGTQSGAAGTTTSVTGALTIDNADVNLDGRTLSVAAGATGTWSAGTLRVASGGSIVNAGTFDVAADVIALNVDGGASFVQNSGLLRKTAGGGFAALAGVVLNNTGTVEVQSGTLIAGGASQFDVGAATLTGGTWRVTTGGKLDMGGSGIAINQADVTLDGAASTFPNINALADNRGTFRVKGGKQFVTGTTFVNAAGGSLSIADAASGIYFGNVLTNQGTYTAAGTTAVNFAFNTGTITHTGPLAVNTLLVNSPGGTADVAGPQQWGPDAHLRAEGGQVTLRTDAGAAGSPALVIDANGGTVTLRASQHLKGLTFNGGTVEIGAPQSGGGEVVVRTPTYTFNGAPGNWNGTLDVGGGRLIVDHPGGGGSPIELIADQIRQGYNGGDWLGTGGIVSAVARANGSRAVGYAEASEIASAATTGFGGEVVTGSAVLVRMTLAGDATLDGVVDFADLVRLAQNYNVTVSQATDSWWYSGDFTYDGVVNFSDLVKLAQNYNSALPAAGAAAVPGAPAEFAADLAAAFASVPEPGAVGTIMLAAAALMTRRRRRAVARGA